MSDTGCDLVRALGYPIGSVIVLVVVAYIARKAFENLLNSVVQRDLEAMKAENSRKLVEIQNSYNFVLEDRKAELGLETERLKTQLSTAAETHRLAAQKRFEVLLNLWESSEALLKSTNFKDIESIKAGIEKVASASADVQRYGVLMDPLIRGQVQNYLEKTLTVLTTSEAKIKNPNADAKVLKQIVSSVFALSPLGSVFAPLFNMLVTSSGPALESTRRLIAENARAILEGNLRVQFGVPLLKAADAITTSKTTVTETGEAGV